MNMDQVRNLSKVRSILSVPGHDEHKASKARTRGADLIMWDLEDSVPATSKVKALNDVLFRAAPVDMVRLNHPSAPASGFEIKELRDAGVSLVMVPKVESSLDLWRVHSAFLGNPLRMIVCLESPAGIWNLAKILGDGPPSVAGLAFGCADFVATSPWDSGALLDHAALQVCMAAAALGIHATDGPHYNLGKDSGLVGAVLRSRRQGFNSKGAIHPSQIKAINEGMRPTVEEVAAARRIVAGSASSSNRGVQRFDSTVVAPPTVAAASKIIQNAKTTGHLDTVC